jgi:ubiquinone/menaquinone biosynthesis C-methylase UbiE/uncharacterized protein YbaR (Trm112 family)
MNTRIQDIQELIICPITKSEMKLISSHELNKINQKIANEELTFLSGKKIETQLTGVYVSTVMGLMFPVVDEIIYLLPKYLLVNKNDTDIWKLLNDFTFENNMLENYYEEFGWKKTNENTFNDANTFEDLRDISKEYISKCHERVGKLLNPSGKYLMDAASGPIQFDDYLQYSVHYQYRVCIDISVRALTAAKERIGDKGIFIIGDLANLPIKSNIIDSAVSLNTIYHVPKEKQIDCFKEIYRVLAPKSAGIVVYEWGRHSHLMNLLVLPLKVKAHIVKFLNHNYIINQKEPEIYFHAHNRAFFTAENLGFNFKTLVWRSVSVPFMKTYIHSFLLGKKILNGIFRLENRFPNFLGNYGEYPMFYFKK